MRAMASHITSVSIVCSTVYSGTDQRKHQSSASLVWNSPVTGEFPAQRSSNAENVSIWWRHCVKHLVTCIVFLNVANLRYAHISHMLQRQRRYNWTLNTMTSSNGNIFRFTGPLCGEFTGDRWIPLTKASNAELWCFLSSAPELTVE